MKESYSHKWTFPSRLRARAFGWSGSRLACQRIQEAVSEIQQVARQHPMAAAEGAIRLIERLGTALEQVDSSSGALGSATYRTVEILTSLLAAAPADKKTRAKWLDRLWDAFNEDGVGYLQNLAEHWGILCGSTEVAGEWADTLAPIVRQTWEERARTGGFRYFNGTEAAFSCLLAAGRHAELLALLEAAPHVLWAYRRFGVRSLMAQGYTEEAIEYALKSGGLNDNPAAIARECERILLAEGREEEAYTRFAVTANTAMTHLATFRALRKKYPRIPPQRILQDLIASAPGEEGKWFAAAKDAKQFDLALELVQQSPADPKTLNRAARDYVVSNPPFALGSARASLRWIAAGYGYEITEGDVVEAAHYALQAAALLNTEVEIRTELRKLTESATPGAALIRKAFLRKS